LTRARRRRAPSASSPSAPRSCAASSPRTWPAAHWTHRARPQPAQIELLAHPHQRAHVADPPPPDGLGFAKVHRRRRSHRSELDLERPGPLSKRIPLGLRDETIAMAAAGSFEKVHFGM
jgi:hypothetical protein